jgi:predicted transposase YbfD/YdcC
MSNSNDSSLLDYLAKLPDPRKDRRKRHKLTDILAIAILGSICDANAWTDIEEFGKAKKDWLETFLDLPNGIPSHDTFGRVFSLIDPVAFQSVFSEWVATIRERVSDEIISIDGKCLRGSHDKANGKAAIHMVSAWSDANRLVLGQVKTEEKSNEIKAIPELLRMLALKGCIVTIDAAGCQKNIAAQIREQGGDYVLAVKGNQRNLYDEIVGFFRKKEAGGHEKIKVLYFEETDGGHGRVEIRRYWIVQDLSWMYVRRNWKDLRLVGMVEAERHIGDHVSRERRYYISSMSPIVKAFAFAVRSHWGIENRLHWSLDVTFDEDRSRVRKDHAPENLAVLRHMTLIALKREETCKRGIKAKRKKAGWDNRYLLKVLQAT